MEEFVGGEEVTWDGQAICVYVVWHGDKRREIITTLQRQTAHGGTLMFLTPFNTTCELPFQDPAYVCKLLQLFPRVLCTQT